MVAIILSSLFFLPAKIQQIDETAVTYPKKMKSEELRGAG